MTSNAGQYLPFFTPRNTILKLDRLTRWALVWNYTKFWIRNNMGFVQHGRLLPSIPLGTRAISIRLSSCPLDTGIPWHFRNQKSLIQYIAWCVPSAMISIRASLEITTRPIWEGWSHPNSPPFIYIYFIFVQKIKKLNGVGQGRMGILFLKF